MLLRSLNRPGCSEMLQTLLGQRPSLPNGLVYFGVLQCISVNCGVLQGELEAGLSALDFLKVWMIGLRCGPDRA